MKSPKLIYRNFKPDSDCIRLIPLGDVHYGARNCAKQKFLDTIDFIKNTKDTYMLGMGDLLENATRYSVGSGVYQQIPPEQQYEEMIDILRPIRKKIIGMHVGNHEDRSIKEVGLNPMQLMCRELDITYLGYSVFSKLKVGNNNYIIHSTHGSAGSRLPQSKIATVIRQAQSFEADIYLYGHLHELAEYTGLHKYVDTRNKHVKEKKRHYILTGSFLEYDDSYAEQKSLIPAKLGCPRISLYKNEWDCHVSI